MPKKVIIFNDTRPENHMGCDLVFRNLGYLLRKHELEVLEYVPIGFEWEKDTYIKEMCRKADVLIVNGEGTIHHSTKGAYILSRVGPFAKTIGKPAALINATYQQNNTDIDNNVSQFELVSVRDSRSQRELSEKNIEARVVPDISLSRAISVDTVCNDHKVIGYTDSVDFETTRHLYRAACNDPRSNKFLPILKCLAKPVYLRALRMTRKKEYLNLYNLIRKYTYNVRANIYRVGSLDEYLNELNNLSMLVSGRFHSTCMALLLKVPVIMIKSNSHKIEGMLEDVGLEERRLVDLSEISVNVPILSYTEKENELIDMYLERTQKSTEILFRDIAAL